jgi:HlyD family secretion protein
MNSRFFKILIGVVIIIISIIVLIFFFRGNNGEQKFKTEKVTAGEIIESVNATGTVNAIITVNVGTQVSGTIIKLYADFNSRVKKGQIIALIDPTVFDAQVEQAKANLSAAKANLAKSEVSVKDTKRTFERSRELVKKNLIAQGDLDAAETNYESAKAQVDVSRAQVQQSIAALRLSETNLKYTKILSPVNGIVVSRNVDVGQTVAASFQTPTIFMIAEDLTKMQIDTNVNEADIGKIKTGQDVIFTVDAYPERNFKGKVAQVRNAPIIVQNVVTYDVVIRVDNSDLNLKPGMTANSSIITTRKTDVLKILNSSLRFKYTEKSSSKPEGKTGGGQGVWILDKGTPKRVKIKTGISDGTYTELVSGDIIEGNEIIIEIFSKTKKQTNTPMPGGPPRMH